MVKVLILPILFRQLPIIIQRKSIVVLGNKQYELILQVSVKNGSFSMHKNTALPNDDWPENIT